MANPRNKKKAGAGRRVHYVLSTHWDREWLATFQTFRHRLVRLLDRTLADVDSGKLKGPFTCDGQAVILEDYLEVRPHRRAAIEAMARKGQLVIGPWFVLPDEWLVSGESLVRNIRRGRDVARSFGGVPSHSGFVCDLFGHIGQLPQIFKGFGIKGAFLWRGIEPPPKAHFLWEGSDGTRLLTYRFGRVGYCDYCFEVRRSHQQDVAFDRKRSEKETRGFIEKEAERSSVDPILVFDGGDHLEYDADAYGVLMDVANDPAFPHELVHSSLDAYLDEACAQLDKVTDVYRGELRENAVLPGIEDCHWLIPGVLSSRVWIKQANAACQNLLCHWAEPFSALARACAGGEDPADFLDLSWRWLLLNHPHDSICGCSIDEVHEDMKYRFAQSSQIAERVTSESLRRLAAQVEGDVGTKDLRVLIANPLPRPIDEVVEVTLQIPSDWQCFQEQFGFEPKPGFRIYDASGAEVPYQRLAQDMNRARVTTTRVTKFPQGYKTNDVRVALRASLPPLGYTTLTVREGAMAGKDEILPDSVLPTRHPETPALATSERTIENEFLCVTVEPNGTLSVTDRRTGQTYSRLLTFEDCADIGDGWYHGPAVNDQVYVSSACQADVALVHNGPLLARLRIRTRMTLPREFQFDRMVRSEETTTVTLDSLVTLRRGLDRIEVRTTVDNTAKDHRMRVLFPSGARATTYLADGAFDVVERPIALPANNTVAREIAVETRPQQTWTAVADGKRGLAIVADGLPESAVRDIPDRTLALTLFRGTRRTVFTDGQPEGQILGRLTFNYWIVPVAGAVDRSRLCDLGIHLGAGIRATQMNTWDIGTYRRGKATLPPAASYLSVAPGAVVTSVREVSGALEVRVFNPSMAQATAKIDVGGRPPGLPAPKVAQKVDLESNPIGGPLSFNKSSVRIELRPKEIATLRIAP
jgi:alpha-mannosidase